MGLARLVYVIGYFSVNVFVFCRFWVTVNNYQWIFEKLPAITIKKLETISDGIKWNRNNTTYNERCRWWWRRRQRRLSTTLLRYVCGDLTRMLNDTAIKAIENDKEFNGNSHKMTSGSFICFFTLLKCSLK